MESVEAGAGVCPIREFEGGERYVVYVYILCCVCRVYIFGTILTVYLFASCG